MTLTRLLAPSLLTLLWTCPALADWPGFRGPDASGVVERDGLPVEWSAEKNVTWKVELPGEGWSSPLVVGDKVFVTAAVPEGEPKPRADGGRGYRGVPDFDYRWEVHCLDLKTGKEVWKQVALKARPKLSKHRDNTYASETPVTDGKRLFAYFGMTGLFCYDLDGKLLWKKSLDVYPMQAGWGTASSPVLWENILFHVVDNEKSSFVAALDADTGKELWRKERDETSAWSTPYIWENSARTELVVNGKVVRSYDPKTGGLLWQLDMKGGRASSTPVGNKEALYVGTENRTQRSGTPGSMAAVKAGGKGDISGGGFVMWQRVGAGAPMASPLLYKGKVYVFSRGSGMVNCYDAKTGEAFYERERVRGARAFWASPWAYGNKVFVIDDGGTTHVLATGEEFEELGQNALDERTWTTPSVAGKSLLIRTTEALYRVGG